MRKGVRNFTILLALLLISATFANAQWAQVGQDIDGVNDYDYLGTSVSISSDGNIIAIGSPQWGGGNGYVQIFKNISGEWVQIGENIVGDAFGDGLGSVVSLSSEGNIVAIEAGINIVRVFENISGTWTQVGGDINGESADDRFGASVSLSSDGSIVAIGAPQAKEGNEGNGYTQIFKNISGEWVQIGDNIVGEEFGDWSGYSVSLNSDGNIVAIGAIKNKVNGVQVGHVRVYENISGTWSQIGGDIDGEEEYDNFGMSISINSDGTIVAIGAPCNNSKGRVKIYKNTSGDWLQIGVDINGEYNYTDLGRAVSLNSEGNMVAIGATYSGTLSPRPDYVRIYSNISGVWTQIGADINGETESDHFGYSVSLSSDGGKVVVGAPFCNDTQDYTGYARVFSAISYTTINPIVCDSYISPSGKEWSNTGTYFDTIPNIIGFDSILTINLTVNYSNTGIDTQIACDSYTWIDGITYTESDNTAKYTLTNVAGCDSVVSLNLTIETLDLTVISTDMEMRAKFSGGNYQWLLCPSYMPIGGATEQTFTPIENGYYAVIIDDGNVCVDTTECYSFPGNGVGEYEKRLSMEIYPNPTTGKFTIESREMEKVEVLDIRGKLIYKTDVEEDIVTIDISGFSKGIYFVKVLSSDGYGVERIVVE